MVKLFGYIRKSKVLETIDEERKKLLRKDMDILNNIKSGKRHMGSKKDKDAYCYESSRLDGGHDALVKLYMLIKEEL